MFLWLLLIVPVLWVAVFRYRRRRMYALASRIPAGSAELPGIGLLHKFAGSNEDIMSTLKEVSYSAIKNDGMSRIWLGHILYLIAVDPVDLEVVLKTCLEKDDLHRFIWKLLGFGGIFAPVKIWRPRRKIMVPAFTPKVVDSFVPIFAERSMKLADKLTQRAGDDKFSTWPFISSFTLDSLCETALGVKINALDDMNPPFVVELNKVMVVLSQRIFHLWLQPDWLFKFFPQYRQQERSLKVIHGFTDDIIQAKRKEIEVELSKRPEADRDLDLSNYANKTFLDLLIDLSGGAKGYSNLELREEILTLTIAATDTSANAVGYIFKMLAKYPEVQAKVHEELDEVFGVSDRLFQKEDMMRLKYLECVIKETLRLFPPVPFIIRKVEEELVLPSGRVLPAGSGVAVSIWGTHRNPKYWGPDAEKFDPDRFLPERFNLKHPCAYLPFSSGPRNCVGYQYALMSIKTALSSVLRYNRVVSEPERSASPQIRVKMDIMMKAVDGYEVALERRIPTTKE